MVFKPIHRIRVDDVKTLRVDANFFENGEKKLRFQTNTDTCGEGLSFN